MELSTYILEGQIIYPEILPDSEKNFYTFLNHLQITLFRNLGISIESLTQSKNDKEYTLNIDSSSMGMDCQILAEISDILLALSNKYNYGFYLWGCHLDVRNSTASLIFTLS